MEAHRERLALHLHRRVHRSQEPVDQLGSRFEKRRAFESLGCIAVHMRESNALIVATGITASTNREGESIERVGVSRRATEVGGIYMAVRPSRAAEDLQRGVEVEARPWSAAIGVMVEGLAIPRPFTLERFVRTLGRQQGRPIQLVAAPLGATAPCGLLVVTADVDFICYASNTNWRHQLHIVLHEVGHLLFGHSNHHFPSEDPDATVDTAGIVDGQDVQRPSGRDAWAPGFSASLIRWWRAPSRYDDGDERDAEVFATLAGDRIGRTLGRTGWTGPRGTDVLELRAVFDVPAPRKPGWWAGG